MESFEIKNQTEEQSLNQSTEELLLQQSILSNQKLEKMQELLTLTVNTNNTLPESIENVLFSQLKKMEDAQAISLRESKEELQNSREQHNSRMKELKSEIDCYRNQAASQVYNLQQENQNLIAANCKSFFDKTGDKINSIIRNASSDFERATKNVKKMMFKNLIFNFLTSLILLAAVICGYRYVQNYRDGTKIAQEKAVEALEDERTKLEAQMAANKQQIEHGSVRIKYCNSF